MRLPRYHLGEKVSPGDVRRQMVDHLGQKVSRGDVGREMVLGRIDEHAFVRNRELRRGSRRAAPRAWIWGQAAPSRSGLARRPHPTRRSRAPESPPTSSTLAWMAGAAPHPPTRPTRDCDGKGKGGGEEGFTQRTGRQKPSPREVPRGGRNRGVGRPSWAEVPPGGSSGLLSQRRSLAVLSPFPGASEAMTPLSPFLISPIQSLVVGPLPAEWVGGAQPQPPKGLWSFWAGRRGTAI